MTRRPERRGVADLHFKAHQGIELAQHGGAGGGATVGFTDNGDWVSVQPCVLSNATSVSARVASAGPGGTIEVRAGSVTGTVLARIPVTPTGSWDTYADATANISGAPCGSTTLYLVFTGVAGQGNLFDVDSFTFTTG